MVKNHLVIVLRTLRLHSVHSFINVFGLSIGLGCCLLMEQLRMDSFGRVDVLRETVLLETWNEGEQAHTVAGVRKTLQVISVTHFGAEYGKPLWAGECIPFGVRLCDIPVRTRTPSINLTLEWY